MEENGMTLSDLYRVIKKNIWIVVISFIVSIVLGAIYAFVIAKPQYESTAKVMIHITSEESGSTLSGDLSAAKQLIDTAATFFTTNLVLDEAIILIQNDPTLTINLDSESLNNNLNVVTSTSNYLIYISYQNENQEAAQKVLQHIVNATISKADNENLPLKDKIYLIDSASVSKDVSTSEVLILLISCILGGIVGVLVIFLKEALDNTIKSKDDIENIFGLQVIGAIPYYEINKNGGNNGD